MELTPFPNGEIFLAIESTLKVCNEADLESRPGIVPGHTVKGLVGRQTPSERIAVALANFEPGTYEHLHWHPIEVFYYVIKGRAVMKDINGKAYNLRSGSVVYAGPGIAGAHSWDVKEQLQLIALRATTDPERSLQFTVDEQSKESTLKLETLERRGITKFRKSLY
jgi:quercetin dioxygenase-like cupin family protein